MNGITCRPASVAVGLLLSCLFVGAARPTAASPSREEVSYETFIRLDADVRRTTFAQLSAETRSALKREHARRWLARNEGQLTGKQQALLREAIALLGPEFYRRPPDAAQRRREEALRERLQCGLGRTQLIEALRFLGPQPAPTWGDRVSEWLSWLSDCVGR